MIVAITIRILSAFVASLTFGVIFNIPKSELTHCGFIGAIGWATFEILSPFFSTDVAPIFAGTLMVTILSRIFSRRRKTITTIYLTAGIIPFVPGAGIYTTMYHIIYDQPTQAVNAGVQTLNIAGVIAMGIIVILSLPNEIFSVKIFQTKQKAKDI